jgi:segregation and condensation protein A
VPEPAVPKREASLFDLINAVNAVLKRITQREDLRDIFEDKWTVSEKIESLLRELRERQKITFASLFADTTTRSEVVVTFLALLELIRLKQLLAMQEEEFGDIRITLAPIQVPVGVTGEEPFSETAVSNSLSEGSPPEAVASPGLPQ